MKYINYKDMKDFYTIDEVCRLFEMDKATLRRYAEKYDIRPQEDQYGNWGFRKTLVRKLHNYIYKEQRNHPQKSDDSPWGHQPHKSGGSPWDSKPYRNEGASWERKSEREDDPWA